MANILTVNEAAMVLRTDELDQNMLDLLPQVDAYIQQATGRDWTQDSPVHPLAKSAGRMLMVKWYEDPGMMAGSNIQSMNFGLSAALTQLEALAIRYRTFEGRNGAGAIELPGVKEGDTVSTLVGKIGVTGTQASSFESVISEDDEIQQTATGDLSGKWYLAYLVPVEAL